MVELPEDNMKGQEFSDWVARKEQQHQEQALIIFTPDGYEAVDFYVCFSGFRVGCQAKMWTSQDKVDQLEQARRNALAGTVQEQWRPFVRCDSFIAYVGSERCSYQERQWIVGPRTMAQHFSRSFLRSFGMSD